jgi:Putative Flp pilus-assembly TadE/G-like
VKNLSQTQKQNLKRLGRSDEGQALVLTALALVVLMLMAGLGVDVGYLRYQKQQMQKAADAGALAGASALAYNGNWYAAAQNDTAANGFTNGNNGIVVQVGKAAQNPEPWEGAFANQPGYVEVSVLQPQPTFFMKVGGFNNIPVRSWAVANAFGPGSGCIYALAPSGSDTFDARGTIGISSACGIYIDSSDPAALDKRGGSGKIEASYIGIVGGCKTSGGDCAPPEVASLLSSGQKPATDIAPFTDPLANVPAPIPAAGCITGQPDKNGNFHPGTYCGGIGISGNGKYTFAPGLYTLLGGGLTATGNVTLTDNGLGVTFYNSFDATHPYRGISIHGTVVTTLSAPTTGPQKGILFFQDRRVPTTSSAASDFGGTNTQVYTGSLYFPTTQIIYRGTPSLAADSMIMVGWRLQVRGNVTISQYTFLPGGGGPINTATLAE